MEDLLTANQARELTENGRKSLDDVIKSIESMANSGNNCATYRKNNVKIGVVDKLTELGYKVEVTDEHITVTW